MMGSAMVVEGLLGAALGTGALFLVFGTSASELWSERPSIRSAAVFKTRFRRSSRSIELDRRSKT